MKTPPTSVEQLINDWYRRARESQFAHYEAAQPLVRANYRLGLPVVALSTLAATSVFATLDSTTVLGYQIALGIISATAAVLAALQTFLKLDERAEKHRAAGGQYGAIRRELEQVRAGGPPYDPLVIERIRENFDSVSNQAPEITPRIWARTEALLRDRTTGSEPPDTGGTRHA
jgi:hypothetical protein